MGSLNVNGMRDVRKDNFLTEIIKLKELNVIFLQETHSNQSNEFEWLWWEGEHVLSHGTNFKCRGGCAFSPLLLKPKFY